VSTKLNGVAHARSLHARVVAALLLLTLSLVATLAAAKGPDVRWSAAGHEDRVTAVEFSPDGTLMATSSVDRTVKLWAHPQGTLLKTLVLPYESSTQVTEFSAVRFTPDGAYVVAAANHVDGATSRHFGRVHVFRVNDGAAVSAFGSQSEGIASIDISPDGLWVASGGLVSGVKIWRMSDGAHVKSLKQLPGAASAVRFSPSGDRLTAGYEDHRLAVWKTSDWSLVWKTMAHDKEITHTEFSPGGDMVASASVDGTAKLFNAADGAPLHTLQVGSMLDAVTFSPDGTSLATGGTDGTIRLWDVASGGLTRTFADSGHEVASLRYSNDGAVLMSGGDFDPGIQQWNPTDGTLTRTLTQFAAAVNKVAYSSDSRLIATAARFDRRVDVFDAKTGLRQHAWDTQAEATDVAISPNDKLVAMPGLGNTVVIRRLSDGKTVQTLTGHRERIDGLAFSHDGSLLASGSFFPGSIRLWRTSDWTLVWEVKGSSELRAFGPFVSFTFSADDTLLGTVAEGSPLVLRVSDGSVVARPVNSSRAATFSPDGQLFATSGGLVGGDRDKVRIFRVSDWTEVRALESPAHALAFSPSGKCMLAAQRDGLRTWRTSDWAKVVTYDQELGYYGSVLGVQTVAVAPDGGRFAYGRYDATLIVAKNSRRWHRECD
jgi:WD40 repeat protein